MCLKLRIVLKYKLCFLFDDLLPYSVLELRYSQLMKIMDALLSAGFAGLVPCPHWQSIHAGDAIYVHVDRFSPLRQFLVH